MGRIGAIWGIFGAVAILSFAIVRLSAVAWEAFQLSFNAGHWAVLLGNVLFMSYSEGYRGFQRGYAPRMAARARCLARDPTVARVVFAPLFCMGYFDAARRRLISTYALTVAIIFLIAAFQFIEQPWRGILDVGVVVGLAWGVVSISAFSYRAFFDRAFDHSPELSKRTTEGA